jgi:hypothetical protein
MSAHTQELTLRGQRRAELKSDHTMSGNEEGGLTFNGSGGALYIHVQGGSAPYESRQVTILSMSQTTCPCYQSASTSHYEST